MGSGKKKLSHKGAQVLKEAMKCDAVYSFESMDISTLKLEISHI